MATIITKGDAVITRNHINTPQNPESVINALTDQTNMADKYMLKIKRRRERGLEKTTSNRITPYKVAALKEIHCPKLKLI
jgi:hypothetical protein